MSLAVPYMPWLLFDMILVIFLALICFGYQQKLKCNPCSGGEKGDGEVHEEDLKGN